MRVYRSTDAGAPTDEGIAPILDACLVNGYGNDIAFTRSSGSQGSGLSGAQAQAFSLSQNKTATRLTMQFTGSQVTGTYRVGIATAISGGVSGSPGIQWVGGDMFVDLVNPYNTSAFIDVTFTTPRVLTAGVTYYVVIAHMSGTDFQMVLHNPPTSTLGTIGAWYIGSNLTTEVNDNRKLRFTVYGNVYDNPAAGWTIPFSTSAGTKVYRQGGGGMDFSVNDNNNAGDFEANVVGYERATAAGSGFTNPYGGGTNPFSPSQAFKIQRATQWIVLADSQTVIICRNATTQSVWHVTYFGDFISYVAGDGFNVAIKGKNTTAQPASYDLNRFQARSSLGSGVGDIWVARNYAGAGSAVSCNLQTDIMKAGAGAGGVTADTEFVLPTASAIPLPNPVEGGVYVAPLEILEPTAILRGRLKGVWMLCHPPGSVSHGQTFTGAIGSPYEGRIFEVIKPAPNTGIYLIETSDTWDIN